MEKKVPHYDLERLKRSIASLGPQAFTKTAMDGGRAMGLKTGEMLDVIANLRRADFYKSMTTHADHRVWQDVYHAPVGGGRVAYVKITERARGRPIVQFKEK